MNEEGFDRELRVRSIDINSGENVRPLFSTSSPKGGVKSYGADIFGYTLQEPKEQDIEIGENPYEVVFNYLAEGESPPEPEPEEPEPEEPEPEELEPEEPEPEELTGDWQDDLKYFCDNSISPNEINTHYWGWNEITKSAIAAQFNINMRDDFWEGRNDMFDFYAKLGDIRAGRSKVNVAKFHTFLYKAWDMSMKGEVSLDNVTWSQFKSWADSNLGCLSTIEKASIYYTIRTRIKTVIFPDAIGFTEGKLPDVISKFMALLPNSPVNWMDYNDIIVDSGGALTGAFSSTVVNPEQPELFDGENGFVSYVNMEPSALLFGEDAMIGHNPYDYVNSSTSFWGTNVPRSMVDWSSYIPSDYDSSDSDLVKGTISAETAIHEYGHSVAYSFAREPQTMHLHDMQGVENIGGHTGSGHIVKNKPANQTGGMPKTSTGHEAPPSDYGCSHEAEDFAESFVLYIVNPRLLRDKYPQRYAFMEKYVKPMI